MCPGLAVQGAGNILRVGDDDVVSTSFQELDGRLNLRCHAAFREMDSFSQIGFGFSQGYFIKPLLVFFTKIEGDFFNGRANNQQCSRWSPLADRAISSPKIPTPSHPTEGGVV